MIFLVAAFVVLCTIIALLPEHWFPALYNPREGEDESEITVAFRSGQCPDCGCQQIIPGPAAGISHNVQCAWCGSRFNLHIVPGLGLLWADRI